MRALTFQDWLGPSANGRAFRVRVALLGVLQVLGTISGPVRIVWFEKKKPFNTEIAFGLSGLLIFHSASCHWYLFFWCRLST